MGNRMCKSKNKDAVDNANFREKSPSRFDRIFSRLHLKPTGWKSESFLSKKENNSRSKSEDRKPSEGGSIFYTTKPLSKSSDWTDVELEVPTKEDEHIHLRNPKLNLIFDNEKGTPTPPPRKQHHEKGNLRERIERFAAKSLQALQGDNKKKEQEEKPQVPVEEPLMVKKKINYNCPLCEADEKNHNRDHHHHNHTQKSANSSPKKNKSGKRLKNLSIVSLPNYTDLRLSIANPVDVDVKSSKNDLASSRLSLQHPEGKKLTSSQSTGKLDSYITRCRSFGSLLPQQLKKLKLQKTKPEDITSDDSFGPLEDWDLGLIEHYNPKDASLPRTRKPQKSDKDVLDGIADLVVQEEDVEETPKRPLRRSESLVKKKNDEVSNQQPATKVQKSPEDICLTPPPSPERTPRKSVAQLKGNFEDSNTTKTKIPVVIRRNKADLVEVKNSLAENRASVSEHSTLMKILQEYSIKDKQEKASVPENDSNLSSLTPSLVEFEKTISNSMVEDFINAEKGHTRAVCS